MNATCDNCGEQRPTGPSSSGMIGDATGLCPECESMPVVQDRRVNPCSDNLRRGPWKDLKTAHRHRQTAR